MVVESKGVKGPTTVLRVSGIGGEHNLFLPEASEQLVRLKQPIRLRYFLIEEKRMSQDFQEGLLIGLSTQRVEIQTFGAIAKHSNLMAQFIGADGQALPGDLYGKVSGHAGVDGQNFYLAFTSVPPELETLFQSLRIGDS